MDIHEKVQHRVTKKMDRLFSVVYSDRKRGNGHTSKYKKLHLSIIFFFCCENGETLAQVEVVESLLFAGNQNSTRHGPRQPVPPGTTGTVVLDEMTLISPSQTQLFCDPMGSAGPQSTDQVPQASVSLHQKRKTTLLLAGLRCSNSTY